MDWHATVDFLNVGFGACSVIRYTEEKEKTIIIDGGDDIASIYDKPGRISLLEYLHQEAIEDIDLLVITHPHPDHLNGLVEVVKQYNVHQLWLNLKTPYPMRINSENWNMDRALDALAKVIHKVDEKRMETIFEKHVYSYGQLQITAFPPSKEKVDPVQKMLDSLESIQSDEVNWIDRTLNSISIPCMVEIGSHRFLYAAEVNLSHWDYINKNLQADILLAPHHGDSGNISADFLESVQMNYVVISADDEGTYDLPSKNIEQQIYSKSPHTSILYTAKNKQTEHVHKGVRFTLDPNVTSLKATSMK
ncbi:ComEC/Rec2 family competence protein [Aquibacillus rhizosphaerae]|uniref:MBL fold metallo-hydrolase n=1 Tax=Aquibacillus rhizosphaerae TaxID=3051431 RepID=A0ABT7LDA1_9BACI|nr:MBL fold metallo-hydrolase [Aquibacillus sp. LR5S19]MDL4842526.1 MBL fold metallo-hydrolase [Aquibacillus sp. LR5S19]